MAIDTKKPLTPNDLEWWTPERRREYGIPVGQNPSPEAIRAAMRDPMVLKWTRLPSGEKQYTEGYLRQLLDELDALYAKYPQYADVFTDWDEEDFNRLDEIGRILQSENWPANISPLLNAQRLAVTGGDYEPARGMETPSSELNLKVRTAEDGREYYTGTNPETGVEEFFGWADEEEQQTALDKVVPVSGGYLTEDANGNVIYNPYPDQGLSSAERRSEVLRRQELASGRAEGYLDRALSIQQMQQEAQLARENIIANLPASEFVRRGILETGTAPEPPEWISLIEAQRGQAQQLWEQAAPVREAFLRNKQMELDIAAANIKAQKEAAKAEEQFMKNLQTGNMSYETAHNWFLQIPGSTEQQWQDLVASGQVASAQRVERPSAPEYLEYTPEESPTGYPDWVTSFNARPLAPQGYSQLSALQKAKLGNVYEFRGSSLAEQTRFPGVVQGAKLRSTPYRGYSWRVSS